MKSCAFTSSPAGLLGHSRSVISAPSRRQFLNTGSRSSKCQPFRCSAPAASSPAIPDSSPVQHHNHQQNKQQKAEGGHGTHLQSNTSNIPLEPFKYLSWEQVEGLTKGVVQKIDEERFDVILAITRGGLVPATLLCEKFGLRTILVATVIFYHDDGCPLYGIVEPRFLSFPSPDTLEGRRVLIVDDVWDTGRTAKAVRDRTLRANPSVVKVAVLNYKPKNNICTDVEPDFYGDIEEDWVVYPWERASSSFPNCAPGIGPDFRIIPDTSVA